MGLGLVLMSRSKPTLLLREEFGVTDFHLEAFQVMSDRIVIAGEHELDEIFPPSEKNPVVETLTNLPIIVPEPLQTQPGGQCGMGLQGVHERESRRDELFFLLRRASLYRPVERWLEFISHRDLRCLPAPLADL
jgi:hypothetical protein